MFQVVNKIVKLITMKWAKENKFKIVELFMVLLFPIFILIAFEVIGYGDLDVSPTFSDIKLLIETNLGLDNNWIFNVYILTLLGIIFSWILLIFPIVNLCISNLKVIKINRLTILISLILISILLLTAEIIYCFNNTQGFYFNEIMDIRKVIGNIGLNITGLITPLVIINRTIFKINTKY